MIRLLTISYRRSDVVRVQLSILTIVIGLGLFAIFGDL